MNNLVVTPISKLIGYMLLIISTGAYSHFASAAETPLSETMVSVLNPRGTQPPIQLTPLAPRLDTLNGKTIYLVDVRFMGGDIFLQQVQTWFTENMPEVKTVFKEKQGSYGEDDPELRVSDEYMKKCVLEMAGYAAGLWQQRLENPGADLISMLAHSRVNGEAMTFPTYIGTFILLVVGGNETTRNSISGGLLALSENPEERRKLLDDPSLIPSAVQEIVRWVSPVLHMRRTATEDTEIRGQKIKKGDKVVMWYASGNRDEEKWDDPFRFDVTRYTKPNAATQLGFGAGQHFCLGSRLAELQLKVLFEELLRRFPDIHVSGPVRRMRSNFIYGLKEMPVAYTPEG